MRHSDTPAMMESESNSSDSDDGTEMVSYVNTKAYTGKPCLSLTHTRTISKKFPSQRFLN